MKKKISKKNVRSVFFLLIEIKRVHQRMESSVCDRLMIAITWFGGYVSEEKYFGNEFRTKLDLAITGNKRSNGQCAMTRLTLILYECLFIAVFFVLLSLFVDSGAKRNEKSSLSNRKIIIERTHQQQELDTNTKSIQLTREQER